MITSQKEYNELLYLIKDSNSSEDIYYRIPADEPIYEINLNTRTIFAPEFLSVETDHNSEVIWFKVDRFFDDVDLFDSTCWIKYVNANGDSHFSLTKPMVIKESNHDILYLPWVINDTVAKSAGNVKFSFRFFKIGESKKVYFDINTMPATSKILHGLNAKLDEFIEDSELNPQYSEFMTLLQELTAKYDKLNKDYELYWIEA